jgi:hypothetical protein
MRDVSSAKPLADRRIQAAFLLDSDQCACRHACRPHLAVCAQRLGRSRSAARRGPGIGCLSGGSDHTRQRPALKAYSGRPRPVDVTLFGGDMGFAAVGDFSGACISNCSFVSGEAAAAGWLLCLIPLLRGPFRHILAALLIDISVAAPFLRVVMGSHFLSDAILGWLIGAMSLPALAASLAAMPRGISATLDRLR